MSSFQVLKNRRELVEKTSELILNSKREVLGMGRHIAWIETESTFSNAIRQARQRSVSIRLITVKEQTPAKFVKAFESVGCYVRFYNHGDIRVLIFDRQIAIIAIPSNTTLGSPFFTREYVGILTDDDYVVRQLCQRFDEIWEKARKGPREVSLHERILYFLEDTRNDIIIGISLMLLGYVVSYLLSFFKI
jgi:sugar-specific transcriptional regulator TrmB